MNVSSIKRVDSKERINFNIFVNVKLSRNHYNDLIHVHDAATIVYCFVDVSRISVITSHSFPSPYKYQLKLIDANVRSDVWYNKDI